MEEHRASIRNFCIIAHIDHGKSTLADRLLEQTGTISSRDMRDQVLDMMDLERERGITIKLQPATMAWKGHQLNLIDTPGHIDFSYEVSRSLAAVEGALLLVDASQGIEAQTLANLYLALEEELTVIPVLNKVDLPAADIPRVRNDVCHLLGCAPEDVLLVSAKTGLNVEALLDAIVARIPHPKPARGELRSLIFDAQYDEFKGVVVYVRLIDGHVAVGDHIRFIQTSVDAEVLEVGIFKPKRFSTGRLDAGQIGYIITNIKDIDRTRVGDTITHQNVTVEPLRGYREVTPMVYAGVYPEDAGSYDKLRKAIYKLKLNDASLTFVPDQSDVLGFGYRCGFLGLLHLEIFQERLRREFGLTIVVTVPTVAYRVTLHNGSVEIVTAPAALPDRSHIQAIEQPMVDIDIVTPKQYMGVIMEYTQRRHGIFKTTEFIDDERVILRYHMPLASVITDYYDTIKNISSGYASYSYAMSAYEPCDIVRLDILVAEDRVPSLATLVPEDEATSIGRSIVVKLKEVLPRVQFVIKIQAAVGGKIIASERLSALRKDVTAKLYGGDVTRKRKLLEKQKKGKRRMASHGRVAIPPSAYLAILKRG